MQKPGKSDPAVLRALCEQALVLHRAGRLDEAAALYDKVLRRNPKHPDALHLLGALRVQAGQPELAVPQLQRAIRANPAHAPAHAHLGVALWKLERHAEALASYDAAIALRPMDAGAHNSRGIVLGSLQRHAEALASHDTALALDPNSADAHYNRGVQLQALGRPDAALASQDRALALNPNNAEAHNNRGTALNSLGWPGEALASYDRAIALKPDYAEAHSNRGVALSELKRFDAALESYDRAIAIDPDHVDAHLNRSFTRLLVGDFEGGWRDYEWRKRTWDAAARRFDERRPWRGEPPEAGGRLFLYHEQGFGDTLQFSRYAALLRDRGFEVSLSVQAPMTPLLGPLLPGVRLLGEDERPDDFDFQASLMSLPGACGTTLATIPPPLAYRPPNDGRRAHVEARLGPKTRPRVGLAWSGRANHKNDHNRSIAFEQLRPLLSDDIDWVALQNEIRPGDEAAFGACGKVAFLGEVLGDFADTAALVGLMDLVISVDTSLAHLAGAMGKSVWVLLPFGPEWRWMLNRDDSPWYPVARLFRQPAPGDWKSVLDAVAAALRSLPA